MNDEELKLPNWQALLQNVLLESDREKLVTEVQRLETLIFERLQNPSLLSGDPYEREALARALSVLLNIKRDRLGFPDWK
jgi:hypothetical protein